MACLRGARGSSPTYKKIKPTLAEIQEKMESSAKKVAKKQMAQSDVKTRSQMFSRIECPACLRKFCENAAEAHIKYCLEKAKNIQNTNKNSAKK